MPENYHRRTRGQQWRVVQPLLLKYLIALLLYACLCVAAALQKLAGRFLTAAKNFITTKSP